MQTCRKEVNITKVTSQIRIHAGQRVPLDKLYGNTKKREQDKSNVGSGLSFVTF